MAIKIKYHSPLPGTLTPGLVFSLLDAFLHFKNFIKALLQCGKCQREMHWRQIGISLIVKLLLLTDVLLCLLRAREWNARLSGRQSCLFLSHAICWKLQIYFPAVKCKVAKVAGSERYLVQDFHLEWRLLTRIHVKVVSLFKTKTEGMNRITKALLCWITSALISGQFHTYTFSYKILLLCLSLLWCV